MVNLAAQNRLQSLIKTLADGEFHSGPDLAKQLQVSRTAIWKMIDKLRFWQIDVYSVRSKGYKIAQGLILLDQDKIKRALQGSSAFFEHAVILPSIDSTSSYISRQWRQQPQQCGSATALLCVAEHQTQGRGRKGRKWVSPFASNLTFSIGVSLPFGLNTLGGLSLAVGICLAEVLNRFTHTAVKLKWPNDLLIERKKLAGILVEASGDHRDSSFINIGIGLNWDMSSDQAIDQDWCNLKDYLPQDYRRDDVLIQLLLALDQCLPLYAKRGFDAFRGKWRDYSAFIDQTISIETRQGKVLGEEVGINEKGAIRVKTAEGESLFYSGEVSLRAV